ncbi:AAA family ATPase [Mesorhizobium sp.]|uniref:dTMP kinase n=1 Tax=Mesorhizobium sp. TaxID=1871066 RepID=UPI0025BDA4C4|nr:AAA family ATPase [Mesorhizobium sp.]
MGKLIVFEGPDGVGKTSTLALVSKALATRDLAHAVISFPGREAGTLGRVVYDIHHQPTTFGIKRLSAAAKQALHISAHLDAIETNIRPKLDAGGLVLLDRYWWSTWVYGIVDGIPEDLLRPLIEAEKVQWGDIRPRLALLIDRQEPINRNEDPEKWRRWRHEYQVLARREQEHYAVETVRNTSSQEEIADTIITLIQSL